MARRGLFVGVVLLLAARSGGEEPPSAQPTFAAGTALVAVDARVFDEQGRPVPDLDPEDFVLSVGGRIRPVAFATFRGYEAPAEPVEPSRWFSTNERAAPGRFVMIVVDQATIGGGGRRGALSSAGRLLDRLTSRDRVALVTLPQGSGPVVDFTTDHRKVREALDRVSGQARPDRSRVGVNEAIRLNDSVNGNDEDRREVMNRECAFLRGPSRSRCESEVLLDAATTAAMSRAQTQQAEGSLRSLIERLKDVDAPKTMLLISEGLLETDSSALENLAGAAGRARVELLVLLLEGGGSDASVGRLVRASGASALLQADGLDRLASLSGGALFRVGTSGASIYDRIATELSGAYLLGFEAESDDRDGRHQDVRVSVRRPGLTVRAARSIAVPRPPAVEPTRLELLAAALRGPVVGDLPMRVTAYTVREPGTSQVRLLVSAEIGLRGGAVARGLTVGFFVRDGSGRVVASGAEDLPDRPANADRGEPRSFVGAAAVPPGSYTLRLAALDGRGRRGTVDHPVKASLSDAGQIAVSDLILSGPSRGGALRPDVDPEVRGGSLLAYLELYGRDPRALQQASVVLELAGSESGPALVSLAASVAAASEPDRRIAQASLPVDRLPAGEYVARAVVSVAGQAVRRVMQPFHVVGEAGHSEM
jgi:VWFA-related protein